MARVTEVTRVIRLAKVKEVEGITEVQLVATATMIQPWMAGRARRVGVFYFRTGRVGYLQKSLGTGTGRESGRVVRQF